MVLLPRSRVYDRLSSEFLAGKRSVPGSKNVIVDTYRTKLRTDSFHTGVSHLLRVRTPGLQHTSPYDMCLRSHAWRTSRRVEFDYRIGNEKEALLRKALKNQELAFGYVQELRKFSEHHTVTQVSYKDVISSTLR